MRSRGRTELPTPLNPSAKPARVIKTYVQTKDLSIVMVTKDAQDLKRRLVTDQFSAVKYDAPKPALAAEDKLIGSLKLAIPEAAVRITPVDEVFAK